MEGTPSHRLFSLDMEYFSCCSCWSLCLILPVLYYFLRYLWELIPLSNLRSRAVLITGCDSGFGRLLALKLAQNGITVFAGCLTEKGEESLKKEINNVLEPINAIHLDVTSDDSVRKAFELVKLSIGKSGKKLWAVVNNAGIFTTYGPDDWCAIEDYQLSLDVNTLGVIRVTQMFKPLIKASKGRIITVTSAAGRISLPAGAPYAVGKFAAEAYMDAIRQELYPYSVTCCILEPGVFKTALIDENAENARVEKAWKRMSQSVRDEYGEEFKEIFKTNWNKFYQSIGSPRLDYVVDSYYHAITARYPRYRYRVGYDSMFVYIPMSFMPTEISDGIFRLLTRLASGGKAILPKALQ